jgi:hypothetical protein
MVYLATSLEIQSILLTLEIDIEVRGCARFGGVFRFAGRAVPAFPLPSLPGAVDLD